jgi:pre-rRNA-processing protein IPI3
MEGDYPLEEMLRDHAFFVHPASNGSTTSNTAQSLQTRITALETEVADLKDQLGRAKGVNDMMWETVVKRVVDAATAAKADHDEQTHMSVDEDSLEEQRSRKRGRTRQ